MRQASWNEMFAPRRESLVLTPDIPQEPQGWRRFFWWEDVLSFLLLSLILFAVVDSVYRAGWVAEMPSLYPITFFGLLMGAMLARVRWPEVAIHLLALPLGAAAALSTILSIVPGATPWARYDELHERMGAWFNIAFNGGISSDDLPFIVLVVPLAWLAAYLSSCAVFRWRNVWLALIPAGFLLLSNVSYFSDQFSFSVLVFLFAGALLVTRLHLISRSKAWREEDTPYPPFLSLSVLHVTFWLAIVLMVVAWIMPQAGESGPLGAAWDNATAPISARAERLSRLFVAVRGPQDALVHRYDNFVPFQGAIELPETLVLDVVTEPLDQRRYLRAKSFEIYTPTGWRQGARRDIELEADEITRVDDDLSARTTVSAWITSEGKTGDTAFSIGQPRRVDEPATALWMSGLENVTGVNLTGSLRDGSTFQTTGSLSVATVEELRSAGNDYPAVMQLTYRELPVNVFIDVRRLALGLTAADTNAYDAAASIEDYLRTFPIDLDIPQTPRGLDTITYFLFELQRGYFDYHASAMVVILRSIDIPARLAVGYVLQPEERQPNTNRYRVTEQSAFAWPEVYFPGFGWIEFNPTPSQPRIQRFEPIIATAADDEDGEDVPATLGLENLPGQIGAEGDAGALALGTGSSSNRNRWILLGVLAGLGAILMTGAGWGRYLWVRGLAGVPEAAQRWEQTIRLASWSGNGPDPAQTPHEFAAKLGERVGGLDGVDVLADRYVQQQFSQETAAAQEGAGFTDTWQRVRNRLLRKLLRLK
ncbi:MAG: transglutaminase domain-containing protein [Chloroflexi bacterium]|nr:transglutaminase domain-containing protein [Chloroflexota bacterium]